MAGFIGALAKKAGKKIGNRAMQRLKNPGSKGGGGSAQEALNSAPDVPSKIQIKRGSSKNSGSKY